MIEELKRKWEEWYGDLLSEYQWFETEHKSRKLLYVCGRAVVSSDERGLASDFTQVIGYCDGQPSITQEEQKEIEELFRTRHGAGSISFWTF